LLDEPHKNPNNSTDVSEVHSVEIDQFVNQQVNSLVEKSPAQILLARITDYDISDQASYPIAKWEEYFAILALAAIGELYWIYKEDKEITATTVGLAAEAMEALTLAEVSLEIPAIDESLRRKISLQNRKNAIKQHAATNDLKVKFRTWSYREYLSNPGDEKPTRRRAARRYVDKLIKEGLAPELSDQNDLVRTLAESLRKNFPSR